MKTIKRVTVKEVSIIFSDDRRIFAEVIDADTDKCLILELCNNDIWKGRLGTKGTWKTKTQRNDKYCYMRKDTLLVRIT